MRTIKYHYVTIIVLLGFLYIVFRMFFAPKLFDSKYGKSANPIREKVRIPIIESSMTINRNTVDKNGGKWENKDGKVGIVHLWKFVTSYDHEYQLYEETDLFKKYVSNDYFMTLNVSSKIFGDSVSDRKAFLREVNNGVEIFSVTLDERRLDSIFQLWGLKTLVKGN